MRSDPGGGHPVGQDVGSGDRPDLVEVRRSARRTRTVSAHREGGRVVVLLPARLSAAQEQAWVQRMVERLHRSERRRRPTDTGLAERAATLAVQYLNAAPRPTGVTWSRSQQHRWGSCTPDLGTIRISERARDLPGWVLDYILLHELAHLVEASHSPRFWSLLDAYPRTERARGWLAGYDHRSSVPGTDHGSGGDPGAADGCQLGSDPPD